VVGKRGAKRPTVKPSLWQLRPIHARKYAHFSDEWFRICDERFRIAFAASGELWPK